jgi:DNA-binding transcriptional regulator GbsR (MarR family)
VESIQRKIALAYNLLIRPKTIKMTTATSSLTAQREAVEKMGVTFDQQGFSPINGRIFAYLLLAEPRYKSMEELQDFLQASKSSISTSLKQLTRKNFIQQLTFNGDRRRYYQINMKGYLDRSKRRLARLDAVNGTLNEVLAQRSKESDPSFRAELEELVAFNEFITKAATITLAAWERGDPLSTDHSNVALTGIFLGEAAGAEVA